LLPRLTVNRQFVGEFLSADAPCFALGVVEERKRRCGFLALRPEEAIPPDVTSAGFSFGHCLFDNATFEVVQFSCLERRCAHLSLSSKTSLLYLLINADHLKCIRFPDAAFLLRASSRI
jgi:hypothetical protein